MSAYDSALEVPPQPLAQFVQEAGCSDGIDFQSSRRSALTVRVHTRVFVVSPGRDRSGKRRRAVTGGRLFLESTPIRVEGATAGGSAIKAGWIQCGPAPRDAESHESRHDLFGPGDQGRQAVRVASLLAVRPIAR